jgi:hypothetical protein
MEMRTEIKMEVWRASGCRHFLRGPSGAIGSSSTSKQVSKQLDTGAQINFGDLTPYSLGVEESKPF